MNPLGRLIREVKLRTDFVGMFPDAKALVRLANCVLIEAHNEWQSRERRYLSKSSVTLLAPPKPTVLPTPALRTEAKATGMLNTAAAECTPALTA